MNSSTIDKLLLEDHTSWIVFIEANLLALIILCIILYTRKKSNKVFSKLYSNKLFDRIIISTILVLLFDSLMWVFNYQTFSFARILNIVFSTLCYIFTPFTSYLALIYVHDKVKLHVKRKKLVNWFFLIPVIITTIIALINLKTEWVFYIDKNNIYHRGKIFLLYTILSFVYLLISCALALVASKKEKYPQVKKDYRILSTFIIPAFICGILQTLSGLSVTWIGVSLSIFILYVTVQNSMLFTDSLTGVGNRRSYEIRLSDEAKYAESSGTLFAIMFDVDHFKSINDKYGHHSGDNVLVTIGHILGKVCFEEKSFVFRYGGDEFAILGSSTNPKEYIDTLLIKINELLAQYNKTSLNGLQISLSHGYAIYDTSIDKSTEAFMSRADKAMYKEKNNKGN